MKTAELTDRALVRIDGAEVVDFLQNLVTCDVETLKTGEMTFGALLMPQGKILFDFFCQRTESGFLFDINSELKADFIKRMTFYKLRAAVEISAVDGAVFALWDGAPEGGAADPRLAAMGFRQIAGNIKTNATLDDYHAHRIAIGMPQGRLDYGYGEAFPHDAMMDFFEAKGAGVAFEKGCYVGQEVVSRMKHRGTARRRIVIVDGPLPEPGAEVKADGRTIGTLGSVSNNQGLAMVRIDRLGKALADNLPVTINDQAVTARIPDWADITLESQK